MFSYGDVIFLGEEVSVFAFNCWYCFCDSLPLGRLNHPTLLLLLMLSLLFKSIVSLFISSNPAASVLIFPLSSYSLQFSLEDISSEGVPLSGCKIHFHCLSLIVCIIELSTPTLQLLYVLSNRPSLFSCKSTSRTRLVSWYPPSIWSMSSIRTTPHPTPVSLPFFSADIIFVYMKEP